MADRVPASIRIGGQMSRAVFAEFVLAITSDGLSLEWGGAPFEAEQRVAGEPLELFDDSCAWGKIDNLEAFCVAHGLPFVRWAGSCPGEWSCERLVFRGAGTVDSYMVDESDRVLLDRRLLEDFGSLELAYAYFDAAELVVPALIVGGDPPSSSGAPAPAPGSAGPAARTEEG